MEAATRTFKLIPEARSSFVELRALTGEDDYAIVLSALELWAKLLPFAKNDSLAVGLPGRRAKGRYEKVRITFGGDPGSFASYMAGSQLVPVTIRNSPELSTALERAAYTDDAKDINTVNQALQVVSFYHNELRDGKVFYVISPTVQKLKL